MDFGSALLGKRILRFSWDFWISLHFLRRLNKLAWIVAQPWSESKFLGSAGIFELAFIFKRRFNEWAWILAQPCSASEFEGWARIFELAFLFLKKIQWISMDFGSALLGKQILRFSWDFWTSFHFLSRFNELAWIWAQPCSESKF